MFRETESPDEQVAIKTEPNVPRAHLNSISLEYIDAIKKEKAEFCNRFPLTAELIDHAIDKVHTTGRVPGRELHCDVSKPAPMKLTERVYVPVKQFPTFNFVGKILGPKGNTLRRLEQKTQCKISIKGRNSMRDQEKEEELRQSGEPEYAHLNRSLFVEISTVGSPIDCYTRLALALDEIRQYLVPDKNDEISQEQRKEIKLMTAGGTAIIKTSPQTRIEQIEETAPPPTPSPPPIPSPPTVVKIIESPKPALPLKGILKKPKVQPEAKEPIEAVEEPIQTKTPKPQVNNNPTKDVEVKEEPRMRRELKGPKLKRVAMRTKNVATPKRARGPMEH